MKQKFCLVWFTLVNLIPAEIFRLMLQTLDRVVLSCLSKKKNAQWGIPSSAWGTERCSLSHQGSIFLTQTSHMLFGEHSKNWYWLGFFYYFSFCRLMLPLLLLPALLMIVSWSIILLMTHLTLLCLTGKFLTANGINLHQKRFWAIMKSCKFYQSTVSYKGQCFSVTSLFFDV